MEQQIYKGIDTKDGKLSLVWVKGDLMMVSSYFEGCDELISIDTDFEGFCLSVLDLERFSDLELLREF